MRTLKKVPSEGGSGGKRGHSGMEHRVYSDEIKQAARHQRRNGDRQSVQQGLDDTIDRDQSIRAHPDQ